MKKAIRVIIFLSLVFQQVWAATAYKDFVVVDDVLWALKEDGTITLIDTKTGTTSAEKIKNDTAIVVLTKDKFNHVFIADKANTVKRYNKQIQRWETIGTYASSIFGLVFDNQNKGYTITDIGIMDIGTKELYFTNKSINTSFRNNGKWRPLNCYHIDMNNVIWLGYDYGEWGGDLILFDAAKKQFVDPSFTSKSINLSGVHAIFDDSASVYVSSGVHHMFITHGSIIRFDNLQPIDILQPTTLFTSESEWKTVKTQFGNPPRTEIGQTMAGGEQIGPATYDQESKSIYFYSQNGFFKGKKGANLSTIDKWTFIVKPTLRWSSGQQYAVGVPINVLKMVFTGPDEFYFLSQNDGIGYFDGKMLMMLP